MKYEFIYTTVVLFNFIKFYCLQYLTTLKFLKSVSGYKCNELMDECMECMKEINELLNNYH